MSRRVITASLQAGGAAAPQIDGYFDRLIKYIPADVVGAWLLVSSILSQDTADATANKGSTALWLAYAAGVVLTGLWTWRQTTAPNVPPAVLQIVLSMMAFAVWVFALGGPFESLDWYKDYYGSVTLVGFTLAAGLAVPK